MNGLGMEEAVIEVGCFQAFFQAVNKWITTSNTNKYLKDILLEISDYADKSCYITLKI